ncbi:MAG: universal stress protein [Chromatiaceae bacterium]
MQIKPTIIAAVDLDSRAPSVIAHGARLAALCGGRLVVVHVVDYPGGYEADHAVPQRPDQVLEDMTRHARASLVGRVACLDLPKISPEIRVETGPVVQSLARVAAELRPRYVLVGPRRLGPLSPTAGLAAATRDAGDCELLVVPDDGHRARSRLLVRAKHWLTGRGALTSAHSG